MEILDQVSRYIIYRIYPKRMIVAAEMAFWDMYSVFAIISI